MKFGPSCPKLTISYLYRLIERKKEYINIQVRKATRIGKYVKGSIKLLVQSEKAFDKMKQKEQYVTIKFYIGPKTKS